MAQNVVGTVAIPEQHARFSSRRARRLGASGLIIGYLLVTFLGLIIYSQSQSNWGITLGTAGPQPTCSGQSSCATYAWKVSAESVGGWAFTYVPLGANICAYVGQNGTVVPLSAATTTQDINHALALRVADAQGSCQFATVYTNAFPSPLVATVDFLIGLVSGFLAFLIFLHATQRNMALHTVAFLSSLVVAFSLLPSGNVSNDLVNSVETTAATFIAPVLLATLLIRLLLPVPLRAFWRIIRQGFFVLLLGVAGLSTVVLFYAVITQSAAIYLLNSTIGTFLIVAALIIALGTVLWANIRSRDIAYRDTARILGVGTLVALIPLLFFTLLPSLINQPFVDGSTASVSLIAFPLALAYVVLRRDLVQTDVLVRVSTENGVWIFGLLFFSAAVLSVIVAIFGLSLSTAALILGLLLLVGILAPALRAGAIRLTEAGLFPETQRYRRLVRQTPQSGFTEEEQIADELIGTIKLALPVRNATLLVFREEAGVYLSVNPQLPLTLDQAEPLLERLRQKADVLILTEEDHSAPTQASLASWACLVPITLDERLVGVLALGPREDGQGFSRADRDLLLQLAGRRAVALDYIRLLGFLRDALEEQKRIDELKDQFIMTAHHELRTPLTSLLGYVNLAKRMEASGRAVTAKDREELLQQASQSGQVLLQLLNTLLVADRVSVQRPQLHPALHDLSTLLPGLARDAEIGDAEAQSRISVRVAPGLSAWVDRDAFQQIITNLLTNALKYSPSDAPVVMEAKLALQGMVEITVQDWGDGIPPNQQMAIFEKFIRQERHLNSPIRGTGLGLAVVKDRVLAMGGTVWVESTGVPGDGATFHVLLPATALPQIAQPTPITADVAEDDASDPLVDTLKRHTLVRYGPSAGDGANMP